MAGFNMGDTSFTIPMFVASGEIKKNIFYDILCVFKSVHSTGKDVLALNPKKCRTRNMIFICLAPAQGLASQY